MTTPFQLPITNYQLSINDQFSMIKQAAASVCKLLNVNSMKIASEGGA